MKSDAATVVVVVLSIVKIGPLFLQRIRAVS